MGIETMFAEQMKKMLEPVIKQFEPTLQQIATMFREMKDSVNRMEPKLQNVGQDLITLHSKVNDLTTIVEALAHERGIKIGSVAGESNASDGDGSDTASTGADAGPGTGIPG